MSRHLHSVALICAAACFAVAALTSGPAVAVEADVKLAPGRGVEVVLRNCMVCHSADYIPMNTPIGDRKQWETEVNKMINAFGAPVPKEDVEVIIQYLTEHYSTQSPAAEARK